MRVTHIRPAPPTGLGYRLCLALHTRHDLDGELAHVDIRTLDRASTRELLAGLERRTGLSVGALAYDAEPEDSD